MRENQLMMMKQQALSVLVNDRMKQQAKKPKKKDNLKDESPNALPSLDRKLKKVA